MTTFAELHAERFGGGQVLPLRRQSGGGKPAGPNQLEFGPAARCDIAECRDRATLALMAEDGLGAARKTCAWHVDDSLYLIGLVAEGTVVIRRLR